LNLSDFATIEEARAYEVTRGLMISRHIMNAILAQAGLYVPLKRMQDDDTNPFQNAMAAFFDPGISDYNFQTAHPVGSQNVATLDAMIAADIGGHGAALSSVKAQLLALSSETVRPFENATLHQFLTAKGTCPRKQVTPQNGWLRITTTAATEAHNPTVWQEPFAGQFVRVGNMPTIEAAGEYILKVSLSYPVLFVDDPYGVVV